MTEDKARRCGHKHECSCGKLWLPQFTHMDPNYRRQGFCAMPCAYCDMLDEMEAEPQ